MPRTAPDPPFVLNLGTGAVPHQARCLHLSPSLPSKAEADAGEHSITFEPERLNKEGLKDMHLAVASRRSDRALALAVAAFLFAWLAFASPVAADAPGQNGTVKIHEAPEHKNGSENANDPKVCRFVIHGFNFDAEQTGRWWIQDHKWGSGDFNQAVLSGTYTAHADGSWSAPNNAPGEAHASTHAGASYGPPQIQEGHYKLYVELTRPGPTTYKHKVFKIQCGDTSGGGGNNPPGGGGNNPPGGGGEGPAGPQGPAGPAGPQGPAGPAGPAGAPGASGTAGSTGGPTRSGTLGSTGTGGGTLPNTAVPMDLASTFGGLLVIASAVGYSVNRRRNS